MCIKIIVSQPLAFSVCPEHLIFLNVGSSGVCYLQIMAFELQYNLAYLSSSYKDELVVVCLWTDGVGL